MLGVTERIRFFGRVENARVHEILLRCHVGLAVFQPLMFRRFAFPLKVLEYMAAGLPILGTADTETEDLLQRHACGFAVAYDAEQVASGLLRILESPERYADLAARARAASRLYDWPTLMAREYALLMGEGAPTQSAA
jgi:glycosyltransferase involved in cell wall biosynthesis